MKKLISFIAAFVIVGALATSVLALPLDGSSVNITNAQFTFDGTFFQTAGGSSVVTAEFFDPLGASTASYGNAQLVISPVDFSGGLTLGKLGDFSILTSESVPLLSGAFGLSAGDSTLGPGKFETSLIITFVDPGLVGTSYFAPGSFVATLPGIGPLASSWTTNDLASATIASSVPEPASLILLGAGLVGIGIWRRKSTKI